MWAKRVKIMFIFILIISLLPISSFGQTNIPASNKEGNAEEIGKVSMSMEESYSEYFEKYSSLVPPEQEININSNAILRSGKGMNCQNDVIEWKNVDAWAEFGFTVPKAGLYRMEINYALNEKLNRDIHIGVKINGKYPFSEAKDIEISRVFADAADIKKDTNGNEISPKQVNVTTWQTQMLKNTNGFYSEDYLFYFEEGNNTIGIETNGAEFSQKYIKLYPRPQIESYKNYLENTASHDSQGQFIKIQAEKADLKSSSVLYPVYDRNDASTEDSQGNLNNPAKIRVNAIGGNYWKNPGQWISWKVDVPEEGYYNLGLKFRQNYLDGLFTSRDILIDGKIPFEGLKGAKFLYDPEWQVQTLGSKTDGQYKIYLTKGQHEIKMVCTMGEFSDTLRMMNTCVYEINELYRRIVMITGTTPDPLTDYFLSDRVPILDETLKKNKKILDKEIDNIIKIAGAKGGKTAALETLSIQLGDFINNSDEIVKRLSSFKNNISAFASWLINIKEQALQLDYLYLKSPNVSEPRNTVSLFKKMTYSTQRFFASFDESNNLFRENKGNRTIKVWLNTAAAAQPGQAAAGRDQAQVLKDLIDESFTPQTGISVDLELVQGTLIEATLAGKGPDVALMSAEDQPVNFAIRGALYDLTKFKDFNEVASRFYESALLPFRYNNGCYALPDTQMFNMFFYRTDVFAALGISAPETWEDFYRILPIIQRNNLQLTIPDMFPSLLFQNGGKYYNNDGSRALFDQQVAIDAMSTYTDFYNSYHFDYVSDFYSRFRSGELVASIQPYSMYNQLAVAAPEISGLWAMKDIPGTRQKDGSVNHAQNSVVTGSIMLANAKDKEASWEFMKWWSQDDIKAKYGVQLEGIMGPSGRYTPANIGTLSMLPWTDRELEDLTTAWRNVNGIPQVPGSYYTSRALTNAFRSITYEGVRPRQALTVQNRYINDEIARKRLEFGLPVDH